jgi:Zn-dependent protease
MRPPDAQPLLRRTFVVGRVRGIEIAVHATWFLIFAIFAVTARYWIVPDIAPRATGMRAALLGVFFPVMLYVFVLLHEMSHVAVARAYGLSAQRVTLFFFGGVAQIGTEARGPGQEFRVALAGPMSSLIIAGFLTMISRLLHPGSDQLPGLWGSFAGINLALALFNLLPGFPLDGGRILRSAFWAALRDRARATRWAGVGGRIVASGLAVAGAVILVTGREGEAAVQGLLGLMLGWFLFQIAGGAAAAEGASEPGGGEGFRIAPPVNLAAPAPEPPAPEPVAPPPAPVARRPVPSKVKMVRSPKPPVKVRRNESQASAPYADRRRPRTEKGSRRAGVPQPQSRSGSRHSGKRSANPRRAARR